MMPSRLVPLLAVPLLLGGCQTVFDLVGVAQPLSASESRVFNGSYQGNITQAKTNGRLCPTEHGEKVILVGDGVLWYAYTPTIFFTSPVNYDGTIDARSGTAHMVGRVTGNTLDALVDTPECRTRLRMSYIYNHS